VRRFRLILDDGTPASLPAWARREIAFHRIAATTSLQFRNEAEVARVRAWATSRRTNSREDRAVRRLIADRLAVPVMPGDRPQHPDDASMGTEGRWFG